jgi:hypothetical protein
VRKPRVKLKCPANAYTSDHERIIEFFDDNTHTGGLISFLSYDGRLIVDVYRCDPGVEVRAPQPKPTEEVSGGH